MKKLLSILTILTALSVQSSVCAAEFAQQTLSTTLPQVLSIEKIIVEQVEYHRDAHLDNMNVKSKTPTTPSNLLLELSPVQVQIRTNMATPIGVYATFKELKHDQNQYVFDPSQLTVSPASYTINNPYDHVISGVFTPYVDVIPSTAMGTYKGSLTFTLGAL